MFFNMVTTECNNEIVGIVVEFVPVSMVNNFVVPEPSSENKFGNMSMLKNSLPIYNENAVAMITNEALSFSVGSLFSKEGISISLPSKPMFIAESMTSNLNSTSLNRTKILGGMGYESSGFVFNHTVHTLSPIDCSLPRIIMDVNRDEDNQRMNSGKLLLDNAKDNPERSLEYTLGTCNDYRRGIVPLITG
jgi:hypothetical protein